MIKFSKTSELNCEDWSELTPDVVLRDFSDPSLSMIYVVENGLFKGTITRAMVSSITTGDIIPSPLGSCPQVTVADDHYHPASYAQKRSLKFQAMRFFLSRKPATEVVLLTTTGELLGAWVARPTGEANRASIASKYAELMQRDLQCVGGYLLANGCQRIAVWSIGDGRRGRPIIDTLVISELVGDPRVTVDFLITQTETTVGCLPVLKPDRIEDIDVDAVVLLDDDLLDEAEYRLRRLKSKKIITLSQIISAAHSLEKDQSRVLEQLFDLAKMGHKVLFVVTPIVEKLDTRTPYEDMLMQYRVNTIHDFLANVDQLFPLSFLSDSISSDEWMERVRTGMSTLLPYKSYIRHKDLVSQLENVTGGMRTTIGNPEDAERRILVFGDSVTYGRGVPDSATIVSQLQAILNEKGTRIRAENRSVSASGLAEIGWAIADSDIEDQDIIVVSVREGNVSGYMARLAATNGVPFYLAQPDFAYDAGRRDELFFDKHHLSVAGGKLLANRIYDHLLGSAGAQTSLAPEFAHLFAASFKIVPLTEYFDPIINSMDFREYIHSLSDIRAHVSGKVGAIVVNCNPFTLGHQFLVETAASQCDLLYVFVVEEDRSVFPYADRFELVRAGTAHLPNVVVLPSGDFIISARTFPEYFQKGSLQDTTIDPSEDVAIFGQHIAPALGITKRFVGEEPLDRVTLQYNEAMARILPSLGIEFEIIRRKEEGDMVISASRVRRLLETGDFEAISRLVPPTTLSYLKTNFGAAEVRAEAMKGDTQRSAGA